MALNFSHSIELLYPLFIAIALGAFVGLRRELEAQQKGEESFMGFRTMALFSGFGVLSTFFPNIPYLPVFFFLALLIFVSIAYANGAFRLNLLGMASEISALFMFWIGVLVGYQQQVLAVILTIFIAGLGAFKQELHRFAGTISVREWSGALQLLAISGAILPFLPREPVDPMGVLVPFNVWFLVILISGIGFMGYFFVKYLGVKGGIPLTAFLGSVVSSTAVTTSLADQSKRAGITDIFVVGILISVATMQIRVAAEIFLWGNEEIIREIAPIPISMAVAALGCAVYFFYRTNKKHKYSNKRAKTSGGKVSLQSPFEILPALKFGGVFVLILFALALGNKYFGSSGVYVTAFLSGFVDVDAIVLSSLESVKLGEMETSLAQNAIILASSVNTLIKIFYIAILGSRKLVKKSSVGIGITLLVGLLTYFVW